MTLLSSIQVALPPITSIVKLRVESDHGQGLPGMLEVHSSAKVALGPAAHDFHTEGFQHGPLGTAGLNDDLVGINSGTR